MSTLPNNAKAVIALTSWKARINTVGMTIFNLCKMCPGFHIVLTLSVEEFPHKESDLPVDLTIMVKAGLLEILWVPNNVRSFKKWIYAAQRYSTVPIISADDDCLYTYNYAEDLYSAWLKQPDRCYTMHKCPVTGFQHGPATLYPPGNAARFIETHLTSKVLSTAHDDVFIGMCLNRLNIPIIEIREQVPYIFHDTTSALSDGQTMNVFAAMELISYEL